MLLRLRGIHVVPWLNITNPLRVAVGVTLGIFIGLMLVGCSPQLPASSSAACPTLYSYSADMQKEAAYELNLGSNYVPTLKHMLGDYGRNREQIRLCVGATSGASGK